MATGGTPEERRDALAAAAATMSAKDHETMRLATAAANAALKSVLDARSETVGIDDLSRVYLVAVAVMAEMAQEKFGE